MEIKKHFIVSGMILVMLIALIGWGYKVFFAFDSFLPGVRIASVALKDWMPGGTAKPKNGLPQLEMSRYFYQ